MNITFWSRSRSVWFSRLVMVAVCLSLIGCTIRLIADYDENLDKAVTELNKKTEKFLMDMETTFVKMQSAPAGEEKRKLQEQLSYAAATNKDFYNSVTVDLRVIRVRAEATPKNELTVEQLNILANDFKEMEKQHKEGFSSPREFELLRQAFERDFRAILKLELAKKRGKDSSAQKK